STNTVVTPGGSFLLIASGFDPGEIVFIQIIQTSVLAAGQTGSNGGLTMGHPGVAPAVVAPTSITTTASSTGTISVPVPLSQTGTYTITATGQTSGATSSIVVKAAATAPAGTVNSGTTTNSASGSGLANTGVDSSMIVWSAVGGAALLAGVGTVVVSRRRSRTAE
ncbi:MAG: LPXTG cell wall anchor domain-containing protein, partial [Acidobacteria bacterium]|nr:LPXTG cell wall anchor domain-containing protein [Acidobacteriota bacterium]